LLFKQKIIVKYHTPYNAAQLEQIKKSDWIDLRAAENVELAQGEFKYISLGVSMMLPKGYEAILAPRSSTFKNYGIIQANGIGIIDNEYAGEDDVWFFPALAMRDTEIPMFSKICQFRVQRRQPKISFCKGISGKPNRGGLGSTGI